MHRHQTMVICTWRCFVKYAIILATATPTPKSCILVVTVTCRPPSFGHMWIMWIVMPRWRTSIKMKRAVSGSNQHNDYYYAEDNNPSTDTNHNNEAPQYFFTCADYTQLLDDNDDPTLSHKFPIDSYDMYCFHKLCTLSSTR